MCMYRAVTAKRAPSLRAWKVMSYDARWSWYGEKRLGCLWVTPYMEHSPEGNTLTAVGSPQFYPPIGEGVRRLHSGAIHCFRTLESAQRLATANRAYDVFEVRGEGYVAHNDRHIAFRKVHFVDDLAEWYCNPARKRFMFPPGQDR